MQKASRDASMIEEANHFSAECAALKSLVTPLTESNFSRKTQFKEWTLNDIFSHLYMGDNNARLTLLDPDSFKAAQNARQKALDGGISRFEYQSQWVNGLKGHALVTAWFESSLETADAYADADPKKRVAWVGPDMSARSSITARFMETWSHSQAIYDLLGLERQDDDRIRAIAHLGAITFGWTFANRGEAPPGLPPHITLNSPSGGTWEWNPERANSGESVSGRATEFCQVVTQTRNIADVSLKLEGTTAKAWMTKAQCFAGPPNDPPQPGTRYKQV